MVTKLRLVFSISIAFFSFCGTAQDDYWKKEISQTAFDKGFRERFHITDGTLFSFEEERFKRELGVLTPSGKGSKIIHFPDETGKLVPFQVFESPVMSPALSAKYPNIKSYKGHGVQDKAKRIRFSVSDKGVEAMIVDTGEDGNVFLQKDPQGKYVVYRRNKVSAMGPDFLCTTQAMTEKTIAGTTLRPVDGQVLRKLRLAVSATGEYTAYHGDTVAGALAAINATVTRVNEIYETDLGITLELVADNDLVIYTNAATDPYTSNLNSQVQSTLTNVIGAANYDIGHLFQQGVNSGDAGFVGSACIDHRKGSAYSSAEDPEGDLFDIEYVAHELGHQLGANHTWSYESEGTLVQVEPGSGSTVMGYAGITGNNDVTSNGEGYFHYVSIVQITEYMETTSCAEIVPLTNNPPVVSVPGDFTIPKSTAFFLEGTATDLDMDDVLTYTWEQIDNGVVSRATFGPTNPSGANFRSLAPSEDPRRYFPKLSSVIQGMLTQTTPTVNSAWETVSNIEREMNFAFTVRDNAPGGGQVVSDQVKVSVVNSAGPFKVLSHTAHETVAAGEIMEILWDVANTAKAPVNATSVDILLSTDGGVTFPITLVEDVPNDGSHKVIVPGTPTAGARLMVKAHDHIFYAVNAANFTIGASPIVLNFTELEHDVCQPNDLVVPFTYETYLGFDEEATFSGVSLPPGLGVTFFPATAIASDTLVEVTFSNTQSLAEGTYTIGILASTATESKQVELTLNVHDSDFAEVVPVSPANNAQDVSKSVTLEWTEGLGNTDYEVEIGTDTAFTDLIETATVTSNTYFPSHLDHGSTYYWRVKPKNSCGEGSYSEVFQFTTIEFNCIGKSASGLPEAISHIGPPTVTSKIAFYQDLVLADLNVHLEIDHSFLADLTVSLTSPSGTTVVLVSSSCGGLRNINATFDDSADAFDCSGTPAISGTVRPLGSLSAFNGESILGEWILEVSDNAPSDGGAIKAFSLDVCVEGEFRPDEDNDGVFDDGDDLCLGTPEGTEVNSTGCPVYRFQKRNFNVLAQSGSCRSSNDGILTVTATLALEYSITISGNGVNLNENFANTFALNNLASGIYSACIIATDGTIVYEPYCFEVHISEPQPLSVISSTSIDGKEVSLRMEGSGPYFIELNGEGIRTELPEITLSLKMGHNFLTVSGELPCQGIYQEEFFLSDQPVVYPNPFSDVVRVFLGSGIGEVDMALFGTTGQLIRTGKARSGDTEMELDLSSLPPGIYFLRLEGRQIRATTKLVKK